MKNQILQVERRESIVEGFFSGLRPSTLALGLLLCLFIVHLSGCTLGPEPLMPCH